MSVCSYATGSFKESPDPQYHQFYKGGSDEPKENASQRKRKTFHYRIIITLARQAIFFEKSLACGNFNPAWTSGHLLKKTCVLDSILMVLISLMFSTNIKEIKPLDHENRK